MASTLFCGSREADQSVNGFAILNAGGVAETGPDRTYFLWSLAALSNFHHTCTGHRFRTPQSCQAALDKMSG